MLRADRIKFFVLVIIHCMILMAYPIHDLFGIYNALFGFILIFVFIFYDRCAISLFQFFIAANYIFIVYAPRFQYFEQFLYFSENSAIFNSYAITTLYSIIGFLSFWFGWWLCQRCVISKTNKANMAMEATTSNYKVLYRINNTACILVSILAVLIILYCHQFNFATLIKSPLTIELPQPLLLVYTTFIYPLPSIVLIFHINYSRKSRNIELFVFLMALVLMFNFPTAMSRWQAAMIYLAILVSLLPQLLTIRHALVGTITLSFFTVFPFLKEYSFNFWLLQKTLLEQGHLDSFQHFAAVVENDIITFGYQLLGVLLFFIPRAIWAEKPISSGNLIADLNLLGWWNISMNFYGEGFINFGIIGVILFSFALAAIYSYFERNRFNVHAPICLIFYYFLIGSLFFVFRGALISGYAYIVSAFCSVCFVRWLVIKKLFAKSP